MTSPLQTTKARTSASHARCPECRSLITGVTDSRRLDGGRLVRRRRMCADCEYRWTTHERWAIVSTEDSYAAELMDRWLNQHKIEDMGERAVRVTA